jgi:5-amino-6-(5-phospho-D-ribitylamino)uracil phosphatase
MHMQRIPDSIKMLVIDIDGTLLDPAGRIAPATLASVHAARQAGIVVTLATARRYCNTAPIASELGLHGPLILYDGAFIVQHPLGEISYRRPLGALIAQQGVDLLVRHSMQPVVHPDDGLLEEVWTGPAALDNLWLDAYFAAYAGRMRRKPYDTLCMGQPGPLRVVAFSSLESIQGVLPELPDLNCSWTTISRGSYGSAELVIMDRGCSKASGVAALAQALTIPMSEVMALGDNNNDIAMLQAVGWGVAMGQAPAQVKAAARAVTASNAEDGAARAIWRYALGNAAQISSNSLKRATCL